VCTHTYLLAPCSYSAALYTAVPYYSDTRTATESNRKKPMKHKHVTTKEIEKIIQSLATKDSHGFDGISNRILKISSPFIISPLTFIINKALLKGIFLDSMKFSIVKPLYKNSNKQDMANYRPICLLITFSKIFEIFMQARLLDHLTSHNILSKEQYGFRSNLIMENATFTLTNEILNAINNLWVGGIFCDLKKVFDCVNHNILIKKLDHYGITGINKTLYESYLTDRYQSVSIYSNNTGEFMVSKWEKIKHGVPQGSITGPMFFFIYINDLPALINKNATPALFADDTSYLNYTL
jgi:hypothetical protein